MAVPVEKVRRRLPPEEQRAIEDRSRELIAISSGELGEDERSVGGPAEGALRPEWRSSWRISCGPPALRARYD
jgi:hypothetical protein